MSHRYSENYMLMTADQYLRYLAGKPVDGSAPAERKPRRKGPPVSHECPECGTMTTRPKYCCRECADEARKRIKREADRVRYGKKVPVMHPCITCGKETVRPKYCCPECGVAYRLAYRKVIEKV